MDDPYTDFFLTCLNFESLLCSATEKSSIHMIGQAQFNDGTFTGEIRAVVNITKIYIERGIKITTGQLSEIPKHRDAF